jgi:uncharacterized repeat protein (TIGR01451 family)
VVKKIRYMITPPLDYKNEGLGLYSISSLKNTIAFVLGILLFCLFSVDANGANFIKNSATANYMVGTLTKGASSNEVRHLICTSAKVDLLKYAPLSSNAESFKVSKTYYIDINGVEQLLSNPLPFGSNDPLDISNPLKLVSSELYHSGEPLFIKVSDGDHNIDPTLAEGISVVVKVFDNKTGNIIDEEELKFFETDTDTGLFVGYINSNNSNPLKHNGVLSLPPDTKIIAYYKDKCGADDLDETATVIQAASLVDPYGKIFDSKTGQLIDGVNITIIDANTGLPATVFGDDGVSTFPSTVTTGGTVTDSSGVVYTFPSGEYRFPLLAPGSYRLVVASPANYKWPSETPTDQINALPNGPFKIVTGSRGETFIIAEGLSTIQIDVPLDPVTGYSLYLSKEASKDVVAVGDFLQYRLTVENTSDVKAPNVKIKDTLPFGFRYKKGSLKVRGINVPDPVISSDGRTLVINVGDINGRDSAKVSYVVEVGVGAKIGKAKNTAFAYGDGNITSNTASATVMVKENLFNSKSFIIGRVAVGCEAEEKKIEQASGEKKIATKKIGRELSSKVSAELSSKIENKGDTSEIHYELPIEVVGEVNIKNLRLLIELPAGVSYIKGSTEGALEPEIAEDKLYFKIGDVGILDFQNCVGKLCDNTPFLKKGDAVINWQKIIRFKANLSVDGATVEFPTHATIIFDTDTEKDVKIEGLENVFTTKKMDSVIVIHKELRLHFDSGSALLSDEDKMKLNDIASELSEYKIKKLEVIGHTDNQRISKRLQPIYPDNQALSKARAESVALYLMGVLNLSPSQIERYGKGESEPLVPNDSPYNMYLNRRVELNVFAEKPFSRSELNIVKEKSGQKTKTVTVKAELEVEEQDKEKNEPALTTQEKQNETKKAEETKRLSFGDGVPNIRLYLEDGTYVITDENGMYHFEGVKTGTHVVQVDLATIPDGYEVTFCEENTRFSNTPYSQFVDLQGGTLWRADFYLKPKEQKPVEPAKAELPKQTLKELKGSVSIELLSTVKESASGYEIHYDLPIEVVAETPLKNVKVTVLLPEGISYKAETGILDNKGAIEPEKVNNALNFYLGELNASWKGILRFTGEISKDGDTEDFTTKAFLSFDTDTDKGLHTEEVDNIVKRIKHSETITFPPILIRPHFESGSAKLTDEDKLKLEELAEQLKAYNVKKIHVVGHTDSQRISKRLKPIYPDNYALSKARAESVANYLLKALGNTFIEVATEGKGEDEPLVPNDTPYNMSLNRRVELNIIAEKLDTQVEVKNIKDKSGVKYTEFTVIREEEKEQVTKQEAVQNLQVQKNESKVVKKEEPRGIDDFDQAWLDRQFLNNLEIVWPPEKYYPSIPSVQIVVKYNVSNNVKLFVNGKEVEEIFVDSIKRSTMTALKTWIGISVKEGDNVFEAVEYDSSEKEVARVKRVIHYSGPPTNVEFLQEKSRLVADGKNPIIIALKLTDKDGHPARDGVVGEYTVNPPYVPLKISEALQKDPLNLSKNNIFKFIVKEDGLTFIELSPTSQTGELVLKLNLISGEKEVRAWVKPEKRDWIVVGLAEGTTDLKSTGGNEDGLRDAGLKDGFGSDGRIAFFAKGMLSDDWLLTLSYDSDRVGYKGNNKLFGTIDPNTYYFLYGDKTQQQYEAQSARPLYFKLERDRFYTLFGDFQTGLTNTELSKYSRSLNGLKAEMKEDKYEFNIFLADTNQIYVKDEIRGDGTSGLYALSKKNIVINSEKITIETRDRYRSEVIVSSKQLSRFIDYIIDYDTGKIFFKAPVPSVDENFNPVYIIVEYEVFDTTTTAFNFGGRGAIKLFDKKLEVGASFIHEDAIEKKGELVGLDIKAKLTDKISLKAEVATTNNIDSGTELSDNAYLIEVSHTSDKLNGKIYFREQGEDFGLGQQRGSEAGTRKLGASGRYLLTQSLDISTELMRQYNLADDTRRDVAELKTNYRDKKYEVFGGLRHAQDTMANGDTFTSEQLLAGGSVRLLEDKLTLKVQRDQSVGGNKNIDFPTRTMFGADYAVSQTLLVFASHEMLDGTFAETTMTRIGMKSLPWKGGQLTSSLGQQHTENGTRVFSVMGLQQLWEISEKWSLTAGLDRTDTIKKPGAYTFNGNVASPSTEPDFTAVNFGAGYKEKLWGWNGRIEYRDSKTEDKAGLFTSIYGEVKEGIGIGSALQIFDTKSETSEHVFSDLRFGTVYRPKLSKWTLLDRLDFIIDNMRGTDNAYDSWRLVNNFNLNYKDGKKTQLSLQYGAKYVNDTIDDKDYRGYTDLIGLEGRYDIKKNWDVGVRAKLLHSWNLNQYKYSLGPSLGYTFKKGIWLSLGYNFIGFTDRDFSKAGYTAQGLFINFRIKFDQETVKNSIRWLIGSSDK